MIFCSNQLLCITLYLTLVSTLRIDLQPLQVVMHLTNNQTLFYCAMKRPPNFKLVVESAISQILKSKNATDFYSAIRYIKQLPDAKECASHDLLQTAQEGGSCCSKTALLAALAKENFITDMKLVLCTFTESYEGNSLIKCLLERYKLPALPSTACFLKYQDEFYSPFSATQIKISSIQSDIEITPMQIGNFTRRYCHHFIKHWLVIEKLHHSWSVEKIRQIKRECCQILENQI